LTEPVWRPKFEIGYAAGQTGRSVSTLPRALAFPFLGPLGSNPPYELMRVSPDWATFLKLFGSNFKRIPKPGQNDLFDGLE
jgi:hypothetical protein